MPVDKKRLTIEDAAEYLSVSVRTVRAYVNEGRGGRKLQAFRIAGQRALRFKVEDLDALMEPVNPEQEQIDAP